MSKALSVIASLAATFLMAGVAVAALEQGEMRQAVPHLRGGASQRGKVPVGMTFRRRMRLRPAFEVC